MTCLAGLAPLRGRRVSEVGLHDRAKVGRYWSPLVPHLFLHACAGVARVVSSRIGVVGSSVDGRWWKEGEGGKSQQEKVGERRKYEMGELRSQVCICTNFVCVYLCTTIGMARGLHAIGYIYICTKQTRCVDVPQPTICDILRS